MKFGDEYYVEASPEFDLGDVSRKDLAAMFQNAKTITRFGSTPDRQITHGQSELKLDGLLCYRVNSDRLIEINNTVLRTPLVLRNEVTDVISFQFVSSVKRSEYLGNRKNVHDLGPALIVSVVPKKEVTYRVPKTNVQIQHVVINTSLSTLMEQMVEAVDAYPKWLVESISGRHTKPRQRVFFLDEVHRDSIRSCFYLPVEGSLLASWMSAKFDELLCIGLQILKNSVNLSDPNPEDTSLPHGEKIRRARAALGMEYANPPSLPKLARRLGLSETRLKSDFKTMTGTTVMQYCINKRIEAARLLLKENRHSISEIGSIVGYEDHSAFSRAFRRHCGVSPKEWKRAQET